MPADGRTDSSACLLVRSDLPVRGLIVETASFLPWPCGEGGRASAAATPAGAHRRWGCRCNLVGDATWVINRDSPPLSRSSSRVWGRRGREHQLAPDSPSATDGGGAWGRRDAQWAVFTGGDRGLRVNRTYSGSHGSDSCAYLSHFAQIGIELRNQRVCIYKPKLIEIKFYYLLNINNSLGFSN